MRRRVGWREGEERRREAVGVRTRPSPADAVLALQRGAGNAAVARAAGNQALYYAALNQGMYADWEAFEELPGDEVVGEGALPAPAADPAANAALYYAALAGPEREEEEVEEAEPVAEADRRIAHRPRAGRRVGAGGAGTGGKTNVTGHRWKNGQDTDKGKRTGGGLAAEKTQGNVFNYHVSFNS